MKAPRSWTNHQRTGLSANAGADVDGSQAEDVADTAQTVQAWLAQDAAGRQTKSVSATNATAGDLGFKPYFWSRNWRQTCGPDTCSGLYERLEWARDRSNVSKEEVRCFHDRDSIEYSTVTVSGREGDELEMPRGGACFHCKSGLGDEFVLCPYVFPDGCGLCNRRLHHNCVRPHYLKFHQDDREPPPGFACPRRPWLRAVSSFRL